jgi:hypothetical protein
MDSLSQLAEYARPGEGKYLIATGRGSKLRTSFNPPLEFESSSAGHEIALLRVETYFSFPNIDSSNNRLRISINHGEKWCDIEIPIGCYDIDSINDVVQRFMMEAYGEKEKEKHVILAANRNTLKCILEIRDASTIVDFKVDNSLRTVLGFNDKRYKKKGRFESENIVNILNVNSILVHCDIVAASRLNGVETPVIYNFFPSASPGEKIVEETRHLIYLPLSLDVITSMTSWLTDQNQRALDLRGEELTLTFHVRKRR